MVNSLQGGQKNHIVEGFFTDYKNNDEGKLLNKDKQCANKINCRCNWQNEKRNHFFSLSQLNISIYEMDSMDLRAK